MNYTPHFTPNNHTRLHDGGILTVLLLDGHHNFVFDFTDGFRLSLKHGTEAIVSLEGGVGYDSSAHHEKFENMEDIADEMEQICFHLAHLSGLGMDNIPGSDDEIDVICGFLDHHRDLLFHRLAKIVRTHFQSDCEVEKVLNARWTRRLGPPLLEGNSNYTDRPTWMICKAPFHLSEAVRMGNSAVAFSVVRGMKQGLWILLHQEEGADGDDTENVIDTLNDQQMLHCLNGQFDLVQKTWDALVAS